MAHEPWITRRGLGSCPLGTLSEIDSEAILVLTMLQIYTEGEYQFAVCAQHKTYSDAKRSFPSTA